MLHLTSLPPLSLYIHFPWCRRKCPYCDFNSHETTTDLPEGAYIEALIADLEQEVPLVWGRNVSSIFIGGGTPSLLNPTSVERLLSAVRARVPLSPEAEITLEANPGTAQAQRFAGYRAAGVNRLSIGVQSFDEELLARIGRIHGRAEALGAMEMARGAGFDNINLDLMFGLPGQSLAQTLADIDMATGLEPDHISFYQLTLEPNTAFAHCPPQLPEEESLWQMQERGRERLASQGYGRYEVSAYARHGRRCLHNLNYWHFGDYLGIGAGAHGKITLPAQQTIERRWKVRHPRDYLTGAAKEGRLAGTRRLTHRDVALEFMMNALRLTGGFQPNLLFERTGLPISAISQQLREAEQLGLLRWETDRLTPTEKGLAFLNDLLQLFLPEEKTR